MRWARGKQHKLAVTIVLLMQNQAHYFNELPSLDCLFDAA